jgi:hypothetical protein
MKHTLLLFGMVLSFHIIFAQKQLITDFESWEPVTGWPGVEEPTGWTTLNKYTAPSGIVSVSKSTHAVQGNYSLQLAPLPSVSLSSQRITYALNGSAKIDSINYTYDTLGWGVDKPILGYSKVYAYYHFVPDTNFNDSAYITILKRKGFLYRSESASLQKSDSFRILEITPGGFPGFDADTLSIGIFYSTNDTSAHPKGRLWIDFITTFNPNSTHEINSSVIHVYPNPNTTGLLHLRFPEEQQLSQQARLTIWNALGQSVKNSSGVLEQLQEFSIARLPQGCYVVEVTTDKGFTYRSRLVYQPQ